MLSSHVGLNSLDCEQLRRQARAARPFPFIQIDNFLDHELAREVAAAFPSFDLALTVGRSFSTVNEQKKVQISDARQFPAPIARLHSVLASADWLAAIGYIMDVPDLVADPELVGGGIHETGPHGRLDVHVDFNTLTERHMHRRLNILVYFNPDWLPSWGGNLELWDRDVRRCEHSFPPVFNRCIVFATSHTSFHGVTALTCPPGVVRKSFAAYYYTAEPPADWTGREQPTFFRARPNERLKGRLLMPGERTAHRLRSTWQGISRAVRSRLA